MMKAMSKTAQNLKLLPVDSQPHLSNTFSYVSSQQAMSGQFLYVFHLQIYSYLMSEAQFAYLADISKNRYVLLLSTWYIGIRLLVCLSHVSMQK
jgi:hypothetical protein